MNTEEFAQFIKDRAEDYRARLKARFPGGAGYLGDGAYIGHTGRGDIVLFTSDGISITNEICLGPPEIAALIQNLKQNNFLP